MGAPERTAGVQGFTEGLSQMAPRSLSTKHSKEGQGSLWLWWWLPHDQCSHQAQPRPCHGRG